METNAAFTFGKVLLQEGLPHATRLATLRVIIPKKIFLPYLVSISFSVMDECSGHAIDNIPKESTYWVT